jgi:hypothetical protein
MLDKYHVIYKVQFAQKWSTGITVLFFYPWRYMEVGGKRHASAALPQERPGTHVQGALWSLRPG